MNNDHVLIIAEAGVNHNGDMDTAIKMIDVAKEAGVDIIKFQTSISSTSKYSEKANYQKETTGTEGTQLDMIKKFRFSFEQHRELKHYCDKVGIEYLSTPFDFESIDFLNSLGCDIWKVPSGEIVNVPYLRRVAKNGKDVIMSTGIGTLDEIGFAIKLLRENGSGTITLLQCTTEYPTPYNDINLKAMLTLKEKFGVEVGLSDHSMGIEISIAAVAMGAKVIEKHFTLSREMTGPDQKASIEPNELKVMVSSIRHVEEALGDGVKSPSAGEIENRHVSRKSIVASKDIKMGEIYSEDNIVPRHAGRGVSPALWDEVIGKKAPRDFLEDEMIEL